VAKKKLVEKKSRQRFKTAEPARRYSRGKKRHGGREPSRRWPGQKLRTSKKVDQKREKRERTRKDRTTWNAKRRSAELEKGKRSSQSPNETEKHHGRKEKMGIGRRRYGPVTRFKRVTLKKKCAQTANVPLGKHRCSAKTIVIG